MLSPARRQITHVLLTRAPLYRGRSPFSCDLHVLGAPLTFVLSQDQTLQFESYSATSSVSRERCVNSSQVLVGGYRTEPFLWDPRNFSRDWTQFSRTEGSVLP